MFVIVRIVRSVERGRVFCCRKCHRQKGRQMARFRLILSRKEWRGRRLEEMVGGHKRILRVFRFFRFR